MGWKNIKEHFKIGHHIQLTKKGICIGSGYVHDLAVIDIATGKVKPNETFPRFLSENYPELVAANESEIIRLFNSPDTFTGSLTVYTYEGGEILEKQCEAYGYPNVTHDGCLMYENTFFREKAAAIEKAAENAEFFLEDANKSIKRLLAELDEENKRRDKAKMNIAKLEALRSEA
jgi:uncharacterized Zn finger protein (UPF0148 family)